MTSDALNGIIRMICDSEAIDPPPTMEGSGKIIPYIGWYWRDVNFDHPFELGDCGQSVGFMESNKWGFPEWRVTEDQRVKIRAALETVAEAYEAEQSVEMLQGKVAFLAGVISVCVPPGRDVRAEALEKICENAEISRQVNESLRGGRMGRLG